MEPVPREAREADEGGMGRLAAVVGPGRSEGGGEPLEGGGEPLDRHEPAPREQLSPEDHLARARAELEASEQYAAALRAELRDAEQRVERMRDELEHSQEQLRVLQAARATQLDDHLRWRRARGSPVRATRELARRLTPRRRPRQ